MNGPKFPHVEVQLTGRDGNAYVIMGAVVSAMRTAGCTPEDIETYQVESMVGDYDHLLRVAMQTVTVT